MQLVSLQEIQQSVSYDTAISVVKQAFIEFSQGLIEQPMPMQILFKQANGDFFGDCHVKAAQHQQGKYFVLKVAAGFYQNSLKGLDANSGLVLVMSATTGYPVAILQDNGWLTQLRTAAAGALAAALKPVPTNHDPAEITGVRLGLIGAGTQAYLQAKMISKTLQLKQISLYARNAEKGQQLCRQLSAELSIKAQLMTSIADVCHNSDTLVTTTPSTQPLINLEDLPERLHIIAVGADSPGKIEIAPEVVGRADIIITDDHQQCLHHGDFGAAVRGGTISDNVDVALGAVLAGKHPQLDFHAAKLTMVDLTGIGAQDLALASLVANKLAP